MSLHYANDPPMRPLRVAHWQNWLILVLAVWLFLSPWLLGFAMPHGAGGAAAASNASWDSWIIGLVLLLVAIGAVLRPLPWAGWAIIVLGIWLLLAPLVLAFVNVTLAALNHWIVGAVVILAAVWGLRGLRAASPRLY